MGLKATRQLEGIDLTFITLNTSERGGVVSMVSVSGRYVAEYSRDPSGVRPLGIQLNDVEHLNYNREYRPSLRRVTDPEDLVGVATEGDFRTNWLSLTGTIRPGTAAYLGPSGTITDDSSLGGVRIGTFLSTLDPEPGLVTFAGLGFSTTIMDPRTKQPVTENDPADRVLVVSPGYAKVRLNQRLIRQSQVTLGV